MKIILVSNEDGDPQSLSFTIRDPWGRDPNDFSIVQKAKEYIYSHFTSRIFLPDVAAAVNVSEWYLSKLLNKETGKGFSQIVLEARVDLAKEILLQSKRPVMNDVATAAGFYDAAHFSHDFKKVMGMTPTEWRKHQLEQ